MYCYRHAPAQPVQVIDTPVYPPRPDCLGLPMNPKYSFKAHQITGIQFAYEKQQVTGGRDIGCRGSLIRFNQGLGKTLIAYALMLLNHRAIPSHKTSLYITTKSGMNEAVLQMKTFFGSSVKYFVFHADYNSFIEGVNYDYLKQYEIIITSHDMISSLYSLIAANGVEYGVQRSDGATSATGNGKIMNYQHPNHWPLHLMNGMTGKMLLEFIPWNTVILDESHKVSNVTTGIFKGIMGLTAFFFHCLSGTPMRNSFDDLYAQFKVMGYAPFGIEYFRGQFRTNNLDRWMIDMTYETAGVELPAPVMKIHEMELVDKGLQLYKSIHRKAVEDYHESLRTTIVSKDQLLTAIIRLRQITIAPWLISGNVTDPDNKEYGEYDLDLKLYDKEMFSWINDKDGTAGIRSPKMITLLAAINAIPDDKPVVIFSTFKGALDLIVYGIQAYKQRGAMMGKKIELLESKYSGKRREQVVNNFKSGTTNILAMTYKIGSESLNLAQGKHCFFVDMWWSPATQDQAFARIHRMGQDEIVTKHMFIAKDSVDWTILETAMKKMNDIKKNLGRDAGVTNAGVTSEIIAQILGIPQAIDPEALAATFGSSLAI